MAAIPPRFSTAEVMRRLKGGSSHLLTQVAKESANSAWLGWQLEYGVISFGERSLDQIAQYVENQREHHLVGDLMTILEKLEDSRPERTSTTTKHLRSWVVLQGFCRVNAVDLAPGDIGGDDSTGW